MNITGTDLNLNFAMPAWRRLASFWSWWTGVLLDMLPEDLRRLLLPGVTRLYLDWEGEELVASIGTAELHQEIARYSPGNKSPKPGKDSPGTNHEQTRRTREVVLCLPREKVLIKPSTLPLAAEENIREVLGFEMDRETPFTAAQVYYDAIMLERRPRENTLALQLILTPREVLDTALSRLDDLGFQPRQVTTRDADGNPLSANLIPPEDRGHRTDKVKYINLALGTVALLLLVAVVTLPLAHKIQVIQTLESAVAVASEKAALAGKLRDKVDQLDKGSRFLVEKRMSTPLVVGIVDELTRILPDNTWATRLIINRPEAQVEGQSTSAAALIPLLESSPLFHNARFRSPVTQTRYEKTRERFHLSVETQAEAGL